MACDFLLSQCLDLQAIGHEKLCGVEDPSIPSFLGGYRYEIISSLAEKSH